jgi:hypothetical protein
MFIFNYFFLFYFNNNYIVFYFCCVSAPGDQRVGIQITDAQFSLVLELENLRQALRELRLDFDTQEPRLQEQV